MRLLGIDYGTKKIGIALGDTESNLASPWMVLENKGHGDAIKQIKLICEREGVERVVLGMPHALRDPQAVNDQLRSVERFAADLRAHEMPVDEADEALTSAEARHYVQPGQQDDAVAAAIMLQAHLDQIQNSKSKIQND